MHYLYVLTDKSKYFTSSYILQLGPYLPQNKNVNQHQMIVIHIPPLSLVCLLIVFSHRAIVITFTLYFNIYTQQKKKRNASHKHSLVILLRMNANACKFHIRYISQWCINIMKVI